ncbi:hypothetical protein HMSSN036_00610 [Paenibacillus macerans]|nr:hypothetical protein HMSSN036_00610 [Paenibacillus macerans]
MKKYNRHAGKRPLKRLFLLNYTAITGLVLAAIILALLNMDFLMNRFSTKLRILSISARPICTKRTGL